MLRQQRDKQGNQSLGDKLGTPSLPCTGQQEGAGLGLLLPHPFPKCSRPSRLVAATSIGFGGAGRGIAASHLCAGAWAGTPYSSEAVRIYRLA